jgi:hypothetical protein
MTKRGEVVISGASLRGGWLPRAVYNSSSPSVGVDGYFTRSTAISFDRQNLSGHIAPGEMCTALADASNRVNALTLTGDLAENGEVFCVLKNARFVRFGIIDLTIDAHYDVSMGGTHAAHTLQSTNNVSSILVRDLASTPKDYFIRFWEDDTDADAGIIDSAGGSQDDDWLSTRTSSGVLTKGVPLNAAIGPEGIIAFTHGQYIGKITITGDLTNAGGATIERTKLNLGPGWIATSITYDNSFFWIVGYRPSYVTSFARSEARMWVWDGVSANPQYVSRIHDNYPSAVHSDGNTIRIFSTGRHNSTKVFHVSGTGVPAEPAFEWPNSVVAPPRHGSIELFQNKIHFGMNGGVYGIGTLSRIEQNKDAFNYRMHPNTSTTLPSALGMVRQLDGNSLYIGVDSKILKSDAGTYYPSAVLRSANYRLPFRSKLEYVQVRLSQWGAGASFTLNLYKEWDQATTDLLQLTKAYSAGEGVITFHAQPIDIPDINSFWIALVLDHTATDATAAIVEEIKIGYSYDDAITA